MKLDVMVTILMTRDFHWVQPYKAKYGAVRYDAISIDLIPQFFSRYVSPFPTAARGLSSPKQSVGLVSVCFGLMRQAVCFESPRLDFPCISVYRICKVAQLQARTKFTSLAIGRQLVSL